MIVVGNLSSVNARNLASATAETSPLCSGIRHNPRRRTYVPRRVSRIAGCARSMVPAGSSGGLRVYVQVGPSERDAIVAQRRRVRDVAVQHIFAHVGWIALERIV